MFTGIVEELGEVVRVAPTALSIRAPEVVTDARLGDSIAVNGVCLTVTAVDGAVFTADVMGETHRRTAVGRLRPGDRVNLERAVTAGTRLGGHIVQGHVDGVGTITARHTAHEWETVHFGIPAELSRYVAEKGSIAVDGVSLTVVSVSDTDVSVGLIPTTSARTTLGHKKVGDPVHIETDVLARHVERLLIAGVAPVGTEVTE